MKIYNISLLILCLVSTSLFGQHHRSLEFAEHVSAAKSAIDSVYTIRTNYPTTGVVLKLQTVNELNGAYLVVQSDTLHLSIDEHHYEENDVVFTNLLTFGTPLDSFKFCAGNISVPVEFLFIDSRMPEHVEESKRTKKKSAGCSEPEMIDQEFWRAGLTPPNYQREYTDVHNIIIHHSAGSNYDTNYVEVIRSIYIFHTEIREWSDIGYNYLIAQNGDIFKGRDPDDMEQDFVKGAHFCGSNGGTMGVCLLGDYTSFIPADTMLHSLNKLLTWKTGKDSLDPVGVHGHPLDQNLKVISGHRDGCATQCPGEMVYQELNVIRAAALLSFYQCDYVINSTTESIPFDLEYFVSSTGREIIIRGDVSQISSVRVFDLLGRNLTYKKQEHGADRIVLSAITDTQRLLVVALYSKSGHILTFLVRSM